MNRIYLILVGLVFLAEGVMAQGQQTPVTKYVYTLEDVILLAKEQSPDAIMARHRFRASYYNYRAYKADYLPKLTLTAEPTTYNHSIRRVESIKDGVYQIDEVEANTFASIATLALSQNVGLTGGRISLESEFSRIQNFDDVSEEAEQYKTAPIRLAFNQPLNGYNELRWQRRIEPLRYNEAKQNYIARMEQVASSASGYFFSLALAQIAVTMAETNYSNSDTLYHLSQGRYGIGTIAEDALLQMELRFMKAESELNRARMDLEVKQSQLRSFLGYKGNVQIELIINHEVPGIKVDYAKALDYALSQSPDIISYNRQLLEAEQAAAETKASRGVTMSLGASFGLNKTTNEFADAYRSPYNDQEGVSLSLRIPILDWNQARDRYRNAQSNLDVVQTQMQLNETDFRQNIYLQVREFNMQENQLRIAAKADTIARKGYEVSKQRYLTGKANVTDLNIADSDKDEAKRGAIEALQKYWTLFFTVRRLTLYDFIADKPIEADFGKLVGE